jgi:hypothetical protein
MALRAAQALRCGDVEQTQNGGFMSAIEQAIELQVPAAAYDRWTHRIDVSSASRSPDELPTRDS